jgi:lipid A ethanolaminephosphotransferase
VFIDLESHPYTTLADRSEIPAADPHRELIVLVVGETARADHFSLNGYRRETNPELAAFDGLISYSDISSCGTSTSTSLPCMFSHQGRDEFDRQISSYTENILDLLQRAGVNILWRDNNSGSKGVASRLSYEAYHSPETNPVCDTECRDVGMLDGLQDYVDTHPGDILVVLHQMGSHGPAYFKRYPQAFERFVPACKSIELSQCTEAEIVNAYDNSILYTDYFLSRVIGFLQSNTPAYETAMLYVSDHGESLGEKGLFLHGIPYPFAPQEQTHVPVIIWSSETSDINFEASLALKDQPGSHDALFNTLLALFEVQTDLPSAEKNLLVKLKDEE